MHPEQILDPDALGAVLPVRTGVPITENPHEGIGEPPARKDLVPSRPALMSTMTDWPHGADTGRPGEQADHDGDLAAG